jgi:hypothetical protein
MLTIARLLLHLTILNHVGCAPLALIRTRPLRWEHAQKMAAFPSKLAQTASKPYPPENQKAFMWWFVGVFSLNHPRKQTKTPPNLTQNRTTTFLKHHLSCTKRAVLPSSVLTCALRVSFHPSTLIPWTSRPSDQATKRPTDQPTNRHLPLYPQPF